MPSPDPTLGARDATPIPVVSIPEIRDYQRINALIVQFLDAGHSHVRLTGAEGQRLLLHRLTGTWDAVVEIEGHAGPELAADLDCPRLRLVCRGGAADGAGRGLRSGHLLLLGDAGDAAGYSQAGGTILITGDTGHRAGLNQAAGLLLLAGRVGRLLGERQSGGLIAVERGPVGPWAGHGRRGGRLVQSVGPEGVFEAPSTDDLLAIDRAIHMFAPWLSHTVLGIDRPGTTPSEAT